MEMNARAGDSEVDVATARFSSCLSTLWIDKYIATKASDGTYKVTLVQNPPLNYAFTIVGPDKITSTSTLDLSARGVAGKCDLSVVFTRNSANATP